MARGAFPDSHPQNLGMPGMHGNVTAVTALQKADLLVALGARFDDRVTGQLSSFAPDAQVVHADIDPAEIGKNRKADVPIVGDAKETIAQLVDGAPGGVRRRPHARPARPGGRSSTTGGSATRSATTGPRTARCPRSTSSSGSARSPDPDAIYTAGVGQHQMWAAQFIRYEKPGTWLNSGGLGTMGYAVPAAMGAKYGRPETTVWAIDGDGCFQMTNQELATCAIEGIPIKVAVINNGNLGMVRQWQTLFYEGRYSNTKLHALNADGTPKPVRIPDFVLLAEALGCVGLRCETKDDVDSVIEKAMAITDAPVVIDFVVGHDAQVWPMVAAGASNDDILAARDVRPVFGEGQV